MNKGKIVQIIGPVVDAEFTDSLPRVDEVGEGWWFALTAAPGAAARLTTVIQAPWP